MTYSTSSLPASPPARPEVVVGLIAPLGVDLDMLVGALDVAFKSVSYKTVRISLIEPVLQFDPWDHTPASPYTERYNARMTAGNEFRAKLERKDALALLAVTAIRRERTRVQEAQDKPIPQCAYVLRSLKTPEEVETLREIYGPNFYAVAAYMPRESRRRALAKRIAESLSDPETHRYEADASGLLERDEYEQEEFGQNIRDTYAIADVFIAVDSQTAARDECKRFVEIVFGHPTHTPRRAEVAMSHAFGAKLRSSSAGRQVGAAIATGDGDILAVGTNEVAKAHGGQYWSDEANSHDCRDHCRDSDTSLIMPRAIVSDLLLRLRRKGWLEKDKAALAPEDLLALAEKELLKKLPKTLLEKDDPPTLKDKALVAKLIEYMRSVHAEMAALITCCRLGIPVKGCLMYVSTFPCHECARLIVAAGIREVVFIEPYPKSRVSEMYDDSVVVDQAGDEHHISFTAFVGVAPRRYVELFEAPEPTGRRPDAEVVRKNSDGTWVRWEDVKDSRVPRRSDGPLAIVVRETEMMLVLDQKMVQANLKQSILPGSHEQELGHRDP
jgi:cytidine deaminase